MNKRIFSNIIFLIVSFILITLTGCEDFGNNIKESIENVKINYDINQNLNEVLECVNEYAYSFDEEFELGQIVLKYDSNYTLDVGFVYSYYTNSVIIDEEVHVLILKYNENEKCITNSVVANGSSKAIASETDFNGPYYDFNIDDWNLNFNQGANIIINKATKMNSSKVESICCYCNADCWRYEVTFSDNKDDILMYDLNPITGEVKLMN